MTSCVTQTELVPGTKVRGKFGYGIVVATGHGAPKGRWAIVKWESHQECVAFDEIHPVRKG